MISDIGNIVKRCFKQSRFQNRPLVTLLFALFFAGLVPCIVLAATFTRSAVFLGNVGIGTTAPSTTLHVYSDAAGSDGLLVSSGATGYPGVASIEARGLRAGDNNGSVGFNGSIYLSRIRSEAAIDYNGTGIYDRVGVVAFGGNHSTAGAANLLFAASISGMAEGNFTGSNAMPVGLAFFTGSTGKAKGVVNDDIGTERMRIDASGNVGIGSTSPASTLTVNGGVTLHGLATGAGAGALCATADGLVSYNSGATNCSVSSQRFKNSIAPLASTNGLTEVLALNPVSFRYNQGVGDSGAQEQLGFIAEQAAQVDSRLVVFDPSNTPYTFKYENFTSILARAVQEVGTISGVFRVNMIAWFTDAGNGIGDFFANRVRTNTLCISSPSGETCITKPQLDAMLAASAGVSGGSEVGLSTPPLPSSRINCNTLITH
jgi:hypothetical protein